MIPRYLYFYQLNKYDQKRFLNWFLPRYFKIFKYRDIRLNWNIKNKIIFLLSYLLAFILFTIIILLKINLILKIIGILFFVLNGYIFMLMAGAIINLIEAKKYQKSLVQLKNRFEILNSIKIISISGSSGKSSIIQILKKVIPDSISLNDAIYPDEKKFIDFIENNINKSHKYFICEMNSYKKNQIAKFSKIIKSDIGILMNINERKLKYFYNLQNSIEANFELLQNLKEDGCAIVNLDNNFIYNHLNQIKTLRIIGITAKNKNHDLCQQIINIKNINKDREITYFDLKLPKQELNLQTKLRGLHSMYNIAAAIICTSELGIDVDHTTDIIRRIEALPHQFEFSKFYDLNFIDDTSGNNFANFKESLKILNEFKGQKVIVTPGISEIGKKSKQAHIMIGHLASKICEWIILVGENEKTDSIRKGALEVKFPKDKIIRVKNFEEAYRFVHKALPADSTVLFESTPDGEYE